MWRSASCGFILLTTLLIPVLANAQYGWNALDVGLTAADIDLAQSAAREQMDGQPVGTVIRWENPATGAYGTVELLRLYERDTLSCREVMHHFRSESEGNGELLSRICLTPDGWKFDD
jgi:surface antigen